MSQSTNRTINRSGTPSKLYGTYPQKQQGLYMQRIPVFAGNITAEQLKETAFIAEEITGSTPLHLTTRQDIELHNIPEGKLNDIQLRLESAGFKTYGAGGDSVRNITVCPCCRFNADGYDVEPLGEILRDVVLESALLDDMPRKFKISLAGCGDPQSKPYVNDLSFVAISENTVKVIGAGSLGAKPETGIILFEELPANDVIPLTLAAVELFADHGERENRRKARLRHIRQKMGDEAFLQLLNEYFLRHKQQGSYPEVVFSKGLKGFTKIATVQTVAGQFEVKDALRLAEAVVINGGQIRINLEHGIDVFAENAFELPGELYEYINRPRIVACPGSSTCKNGLVNCPETAKKLSDALKNNKDFDGTVIAISGCPNNCAHSCVADIGLIGRIKTIDGKRLEVYKIIGVGGNGKTPALSDVDKVDATLKEEIEKVIAVI